MIEDIFERFQDYEYIEKEKDSKKYNETEQRWGNWSALTFSKKSDNIYVFTSNNPNEKRVFYLISFIYSKMNYTDKEIIEEKKSLIDNIRLLLNNNNIYNFDFIELKECTDNVTSEIIGYEVLIRCVPLKNLPEHFSDNGGCCTYENDKKIVENMKSILYGLRDFYKNDISYGHISPENIYINDDGKYVLGIPFESWFLKSESDDMKSNGIYAAPEIIRGSAFPNLESDIYSLGLLFYRELNGGKLPYEENLSPLKAAQKRSKGDEELPPSENGSDALKFIIRKACAFESMHRYKRVEEILDDLKKVGTVLPENDPLNDPMNVITKKVKFTPPPPPVLIPDEPEPEPEEEEEEVFEPIPAPEPEPAPVFESEPAPVPVPESPAPMPVNEPERPQQEQRIVISSEEKPKEKSEEKPKKKGAKSVIITIVVIIVAIILLSSIFGASRANKPATQTSTNSQKQDNANSNDLAENLLSSKESNDSDIENEVPKETEKKTEPSTEVTTEAPTEPPTEPPTTTEPPTEPPTEPKTDAVKTAIIPGLSQSSPSSNTSSDETFIYEFVSGKFTWESAKNYCESHGGQLATIHSESDWNSIVSAVESARKSYPDLQYVWLGAKTSYEEVQEGDGSVRVNVGLNWVDNSETDYVMKSSFKHWYYNAKLDISEPSAIDMYEYMNTGKIVYEPYLMLWYMSPQTGAAANKEWSLNDICDVSSYKNYKDSNMGFLMERYVKISYGTVITKEDPLTVRKSPSTSADSLGTVPKGGTVTIIEKVDDWYKIQYNGAYGYVRGDYVKIQ